MNIELILELITAELDNCYTHQREFPHHDMSERIKELQQCYNQISDLEPQPPS